MKKQEETPVNNRSRRWKPGVVFTLDRAHKPECVAVRFGKQLRIINSCAASRWLGIAPTTLRHVVENKGEFAKETVALVRREYPGLFGV